MCGVRDIFRRWVLILGNYLSSTLSKFGADAFLILYWIRIGKDFANETYYNTFHS